MDKDNNSEVTVTSVVTNRKTPTDIHAQNQ